MSSAQSIPDERLRFPGVRAPKPVLSPEAERQLSPRQLELLDELEAALKGGGLGDLTMAEIASRMGCSLRTLYGIAPSKDELLLAVMDRRLRRIGRAAIEVLDARMSPLDALRAYLRAANEAVQPESVVLAVQLANVAGSSRLADAHEAYLTAITKSLLDRAVEAEEIGAIDTASLAHVLAHLGREFGRPEVAEIADASPKETADWISELILRGLDATR